MAGIEDLNIPNKSNILGDLQFTEENAFGSLKTNLLQGMPLFDAIKEFGLNKALSLSGLDVGMQNDIKNNLPTDEIAANFALPKLLDGLPIPNSLKTSLIGNLRNATPAYNFSRSMPLGDSGRLGFDARLGAESGTNLNYSIPEMPIARSTNFRMGANVDERGRATGDLGVRYQPNVNTFVDAGARFDSSGSPEYRLEFGKRFATGGAVPGEPAKLRRETGAVGNYSEINDSDEDVTATELIDQLSEHNIKVVDYDENEESIKNRLFSMAGEQPRGHIFPSSWLEPSGELTIYVPKYAKRTSEAYKRFLVEEVKHADQIREAPFASGASALFGMAKEGISRIPSKLLNKLPDFHTDEEFYKYYEGFTDPEWETNRGPHPSWKERSGIAPLLRGLRYNRYADPESLEGIHRNKERYGPVLKKYGVDDIDIFS